MAEGEAQKYPVRLYDANGITPAKLTMTWI